MVGNGRDKERQIMYRRKNVGESTSTKTWRLQGLIGWKADESSLTITLHAQS